MTIREVLGRWLHKKGGHYRALGTARHSETGELLVIYRSLLDRGLWARPLAMFLDGRFTMVKAPERPWGWFLMRNGVAYGDPHPTEEAVTFAGRLLHGDAPFEIMEARRGTLWFDRYVSADRFYDDLTDRITDADVADIDWGMEPSREQLADLQSRLKRTVRAWQEDHDIHWERNRGFDNVRQHFTVNAAEDSHAER